MTAENPIHVPETIVIVERPLTDEEFMTEREKLMNRVAALCPVKKGQRTQYHPGGKGTVDIVHMKNGYKDFALQHESSPGVWVAIQVALDSEDVENTVRILEFDYLNNVENSHMHLAWSREAVESISRTLDQLGFPKTEELEADEQFSMIGGVWGGIVPQVGDND